MFKKLAVAAMVAFAVPMTSQAQLVAGSPFCTVTVTTPTYLNCLGSFAGNNLTDANKPLVLDALNAAWGAGWTLAGTTNGGDATGAGPWQAFTGSSNGTINFDGSVSGEFVVALKAGDRFSLYRFSGNPAVTSISYTTNGIDVNGNKDVPAGLSHASLYTNGGAVITSVPEPSTYALMGAGLLGIFGFARRRRNA